MRKCYNIFLTICIVVIMVFLAACGTKPEKVEKTEQNIETKETEVSTENDIKMNIITTDKVLYYMVKDIVKDKHNVDYMFKGREDELLFNFSDDSLNNISKMDLFIYVGAGFEPWINKFLEELNKSKVGAINCSRGVKLLPYSREIKYGNDIVLKDNPYYWNNLDNYKIAMLNIKNAIQDKDPKNREFYETNFSKAIKDMENYQKDIKEISEGLKDYMIIVDEDEMDYFLKNFSLKVTKLNVDEKGIPLLTSQKEEKEKLQEKIKNAKNKLFFYHSDAVLKQNTDIITKYNIKTVNIKNYDENMKFIDILNNNIIIMKALYSIKP